MCVLEMGTKVRHTPTGFVGVITGIANYLYRETAFLVEGVDKNNLPIERWWSLKELERIDESNY